MDFKMILDWVRYRLKERCTFLTQKLHDGPDTYPDTILRWMLLTSSRNNDGSVGDTTLMIFFTQPLLSEPCPSIIETSQPHEKPFKEIMLLRISFRSTFTFQKRLLLYESVNPLPRRKQTDSLHRILHGIHGLMRNFKRNRFAP